MVIEEKLRTMTIEELGENVGTSYVRGVFSGYVQDWSRRRVAEETVRGVRQGQAHRHRTAFGEYQIGEVNARSCVVIGTLGSGIVILK